LNINLHNNDEKFDKDVTEIQTKKIISIKNGQNSSSNLKSREKRV